MHQGAKRLYAKPLKSGLSNIRVRNHIIQKKPGSALQNKGENQWEKRFHPLAERSSLNREVPVFPFPFYFWIPMLIIFEIPLRPERKAKRHEDCTSLTTLSILHHKCNFPGMWTPSFCKARRSHLSRLYAASQTHPFAGEPKPQCFCGSWDGQEEPRIQDINNLTPN